MFTGIIQEIGKVTRLQKREKGARLSIRSEYLSPSLKAGDSLAVNGVCLTLIEVKPPFLTMDILAETLAKTNLGSLQSADPVNLEPALKMGEGIGGHFVTGHIDGLGRLVSRQAVGSDWNFTISLPPSLLANTVLKGSLAVEGVSLTVAALFKDKVSIHIIPYTFYHTNIGGKSPGDMLNIETDLLGKYVKKYQGGNDTLSSPISWSFLNETGFI